METAMSNKVKEKKTLAERIKPYKRYLPLYLMMLPALLYLFINNYLPMSGLVLAFEKYNVQDGIWGSKFVGLKICVSLLLILFLELRLLF